MLNGFVEKARKNGAFSGFDALKLFAVFSMTMDHVGFYFFQDTLWLRAIGREAMPIFMFMAGYSGSRKPHTETLVLAWIMLFNHWLVGRPLLPLNILFAVVFSRIILDFCMAKGLLPGRIPELTAVFLIISFLTIPLFEYGSLGFLFALIGWMVHQKEKQYLRQVTAISYILFVLVQFYWFDFNIMEDIYVVLATAWVVKWLAEFPNKIVWDTWEDSGWKKCATVLSRNTLHYYFIHRILFEMIEVMMKSKPTWFVFRWF